ncbi:hypothetical protein [Caulobacter sp. Root1472]|uniref:hypothetical protein n=1 Tax=Caulobacter sp. Root1472 TaxID=1736470 RepID=UPI0006F56AED|nr:hypothetical protein [Caulobacter sp. Root1472]KQZ31706.1 hypothetical protein ASD47_15650 [Caulobacter sp. Root1472]
MATPAQNAQDERVADVLMAMEGQPIDTIRCAPIVVLSQDAPLPIVGLHAAGRHFTLSLEEARCVATAVRMEDASPGAQALAASIGMAATMTELLWLRAHCQVLRLRLEDATR